MPVFDIETDGFNPTKIHVLSYTNEEGEIQSTFDYGEMRTFFLNSNTIIGHNIVRYDVPVVERRGIESRNIYLGGTDLSVKRIHFLLKSLM